MLLLFSVVPHTYTFASQPFHLPVLPFISGGMLLFALMNESKTNIYMGALLSFALMNKSKAEKK